MKGIKEVSIQQRDTLRSLRIKFGYTQEEAATLVGVSVKTLRAWEKNSSNVPYQKMQTFERVYNTPHDFIFFGDEVAFSELMRERIS
jgi:transcriptional regulator with XRE-family HTH domain